MLDNKTITYKKSLWIASGYAGDDDWGGFGHNVYHFFNRPDGSLGDGYFGGGGFGGHVPMDGLSGMRGGGWSRGYGRSKVARRSSFNNIIVNNNQPHYPRIFSYDNKFNTFISIKTVRQRDGNWCLYACSQSLSIYYGGKTSQRTYAKMYEAYNYDEIEKGPEWHLFLPKTMIYTALGYSEEAPSIYDIAYSLYRGLPVLTRIENPNNKEVGHAIIIYGIEGDANNPELHFMDPNQKKMRKMDYSDYVGKQTHTISVKNMKK
jgi:hypothetical protein